jgi:hypothetical protein
MSHATFHDPEFDLDAFRTTIATWSAKGAKTMVVEWQTGPGPMISWYPSSERSLAEVWTHKVSPSHYNEQYADFMEYRLTPLLVEVAKGGGLAPRVICVDQQPVMIQRQRRRELEHAAKASGVTSAH